MPKSKDKLEIPGLEFNVAQLLKEPTGAVRHYELAAEPGDVLDDELKIVSPISGQLKLLRTGPNILAVGELTATVEKLCGRCLNPFSASVSIELEEEFFPTLDIVTGLAVTPPPEVEEANLIDEQHILDLSEVVRQELLLAGEELRYCRPDCQGLCPICGQDRNIAPCNCHDEAIDPRWAALQNLQDD
ncbi:MAG: DUF177 domain-containing protein [Anaerolineae bacterium]